MSDKKLKKTNVYSSLEVKELIDVCVAAEAAERNISQSLVIEEYILAGIARNFPEKREEIQKIFERRYQKYVDKFSLCGSEG